MLGWLGVGVVLTAAGALPPVDGYQPYVRKNVVNCGNDNFVEQPGAVEFRDMILSRVGGGNWGIFACSGYEHEEGRAWDWRVNAGDPFDSARAQSVLSWLTSNDNEMARRLGLAYIVWNRRYISFSEGREHYWVDYTPCTATSSASQCHTNHVHFSFSWPGARRETTWYTTHPKPDIWYPQMPLPLHVLLNTGGGGVHGTRRVDGSWSPFNNMGAAALAAAVARGVPHKFGAANGRLLHAAGDAGWGDLFGQIGELPGFRYGSATAVGVDVHFVAVTDAGVFHTARSNDGNWLGWTHVLPRNDVHRVAVAGSGDVLHLNVLAGGRLLHATREHSGAWSGFGDVLNQLGNGNHIGVPSDVSSAATGGLMQLVLATDGGRRQFHIVRRGDGSWVGAGDMQLVNGYMGPAAAISTANVSSDLHVTFVSVDGSVWHTIRYGDGTWQRSGQVPGVPGSARTVATAGN